MPYYRVVYRQGSKDRPLAVVEAPTQSKAIDEVVELYPNVDRKRVLALEYNPKKEEVQNVMIARALNKAFRKVGL